MLGIWINQLLKSEILLQTACTDIYLLYQVFLPCIFFPQCCSTYLSVEFKPADSQVHPGEALISSDGVDLNELVLSYGRAHRSVRLVVVQVEGFLWNKQVSFEYWMCSLQGALFRLDLFYLCPPVIPSEATSFKKQIVKDVGMVCFLTLGLLLLAQWVNMEKVKTFSLRLAHANTDIQYRTF